MKKFTAVVFLSLMLLSGCSENENENNTVSVTSESTGTVTEEQVTVPDELVIPEDMAPVYGGSLNDGDYEIKTDSSSSMFNITHCVLSVKDGKMTARMTMGGTGYLYVFMGKGMDASDDKVIPFEENPDGTHSFTIPVEGLDMGIDCAAFSKKKEEWYDRTLLFRSDSLPMEAFAEGAFVTPESLSLADGEYTVSVSLEGGSGRAKISSPARLKVENGAAMAEIVWGSSNYDSMTVDGVKYEPANTEGNSTFLIPVAAFDRRLSVSANTTAMSVPHEIEYTLLFDSETIAAQ